MAPKRKEPSTEPARRSTRTTAVEKPAAAAPKAPKVVKVATAPAAKKAKAVAVEEKEEEEDEEEKEVPEAKKAKVVEEEKVPKGVGEVVPDVTLKNEDGEDVSLASVYEKSGVVIFSYPKANTPGCTTQACGFRDIYDEISAAGFAVYGLSQDSPKSQLNWKTSKKFQYSLLSDPTRILLKQLGATEAKKRCHWVIEKGGKLLEAKIGVKPADDPKNTLAFIKSL